MPAVHQRRSWVIAALALLLFAASTRADSRLPLPPELQQRVNDAVDLGVIFLKKTQAFDGSWQVANGGNRVGYAALPALTLLECGENKTDPRIVAAANVVRRSLGETKGTYELSLSILLLDRIGDPKDKKNIQTLALRLIAGQTVTGGWDYNCPTLAPSVHRQLLRVLQELNPPTAGGPAAAPASKTNPAAPKNDAPKKAVVIPTELKRYLPVLQDPSLHQLADPLGPDGARVPGTSCNSNTQFAVLALAAARHWEVPVERTMQLVSRRFLTSQEEGGGWGYLYKNGGGAGESPTMDCSGLIGLAISQQLSGKDDKAPAQISPQTTKGLTALSKHIGTVANNRYFLWSLERVGVLYDLPKIGGKDWYRWGAQTLVASQEQQGMWPKSDYPGSDAVLDTCMALLFLKKADFTKGIAGKVPGDGNDPVKPVESKPPAAAAPTPPPPPPQTKPTLPPAPKAPEKSVTQPTTPPAPANVTPVTPPPAPASPPPQPVASGGNNQKMWAYILIGVFVLLAVLSTGLIWYHLRQKNAAAVTKPPAKVKKKARREEPADEEELAPVEAIESPDEGDAPAEAEADGDPPPVAKKKTPPPIAKRKNPAAKKGKT